MSTLLQHRFSIPYEARTHKAKQEFRQALEKVQQHCGILFHIKMKTNKLHFKQLQSRE